MTAIHAIRSKRVVTPEGVRAATVLLRDGVIEDIAAYNDLPSGRHVYDAGESVVMPGLIDTHVHINEPGRTDWEGFETATRAAAAGGVTTLIDMPLNSIPATTTAEALEAKRAAARKKCLVNVGFWGGVVPGNAGELGALHHAGAFGFKCFLVPSGAPEFANVTEDDLRAAMPILAALEMPLLVHSELPEPIEAANAKLGKADPRKYKTWLSSRPAEAETKAVELMIRLAREFGTRVHIVHLSSDRSVALIRRAKEGRRAHHRGNLPALSLLFGARDSRPADRIQVRSAHSRFAKQQELVGRDGEGHDRFRGLRSFAVASGNEMPQNRRFLQSLGRHFLSATWPTRDLDENETAGKTRSCI